MTTAELLSYYSNLLIAQYRTQPKATATIQAISSTIVADQIVIKVQNAFDPSTASGASLDILGKYVGAPRALANYTFTGSYLSLPAYADALAPTYVGFASYSDPTDPSGFWRYYSSTGDTYYLSDGQMQQLIGYLIDLHKSNYSNEELDNLFATYFGGYATITDNGDMTVTYTHDSTDPFILFDVVNFLNYLPRPSGVGVTVVTV